jgi:hypothetical protein
MGWREAGESIVDVREVNWPIRLGRGQRKRPASCDLSVRVNKRQKMGSVVRVCGSVPVTHRSWTGWRFGRGVLVVCRPLASHRWLWEASSRNIRALFRSSAFFYR